MVDEHTVLVAVEDSATAGVVAAEAAHLVMDQGGDRVIFLHVLDEHFVANGLFGLVGSPLPDYESKEEIDSILALAEAAFRAEFTATEKQAPETLSLSADGRPWQTIAAVAAQRDASVIVVGARRPHAFGRLTHPDVVDNLRHQTAVPIHIVSLQTDPPQPPRASASVS